MHPIRDWLHHNLPKKPVLRECAPWYLLLTLVLVMAVCSRFIAEKTGSWDHPAIWAIPVVLGTPGVLLALAVHYRIIALIMLAIVSISFIGFCVTMII